MKYKTHIISKATLVDPRSDQFKSIASVIKQKYGFDISPQIDLLYVRSCLVSAGMRAGINDNDDIFTREEAWAARHSPVLKPLNWKHKDKDILGVIYSVEARDLNNNLLDITSNTVPEVDFDLWTEAAVFSLIFPERADEIQLRVKSNDLFVSMEAWFDDYGYGLCSDDTIAKILPRNKDTSFLDKHLRVLGGAGKYRDPESGQDMRIGRVLRSITFGGCGLVDRPANKRSDIDKVQPMSELMSRNQDIALEALIQKVMESENMEETIMTANAQVLTSNNVEPEVVRAAVASEFEAREQAAAKAKERSDLEARAKAAETKAAELETEKADLVKALEDKNAELAKLNENKNAYEEAVRQLVQEQVQAGATNSVPAEIAAIDAAQNGTAAFKAKLAWIQNSIASLRARSARADELETQLRAAEQVVREQEVRDLFGESVSEDTLNAFVSHASSLESDEYTMWRDEKELMLIELAKSAKEDKKMMKGKMPPMKKDETCPPGETAASTNPFVELLSKKRAESVANPDTMNGNPNEPNLINPPLGTGINSGVNSGTLRNPRFKVGGSAGKDPSQVLENLQADSGLQLAGASHAEGEVVGADPFRTLASIVTGAAVDKSENQDKKPGFDPVQ